MKKNNKKTAKPKYPFGGLINQGVTGLSKLLGANDKTANLIGSGVATATGLIPGMQDNLLQSADLIGDIGTATKDKNLQAFGNTVKPFANIASTYMANGGMMGFGPNAELEKQETVRFPDGSTGAVDGPSHSNGGVDVNLPQGTQVFSDKLKTSTGKTFAKESEKYDTTKFKKVLDDKSKDVLAKKTAELMMKKNNQGLTKLFNEQETLKQDKLTKSLDRAAKKFGFGGTQDALEYMMSRKMTNGGTIRKYEDGGYNFMDDVNNQTPTIPMEGASSEFTPANISSPGTTGTNWWDTNKSTVGKIGTEVGIGLANNIGSAAYLADQGKKYDTQAFYNYTPQNLDPTNALRAVDNSTYAARKAIAGYSGGSGSLAINATLANKLQGDQTRNDVQQRYDEANAGINNNAQQLNIANKYRTDDTTAANKGQALTNYYQSIGQIGHNVAQQGRDIQTYNSQEKMDKMKMGTLDDLYNNYQFDKTSGHWIPRKK